ncbi:Cu-Zn family superoxide dismutase [Rheinheimera pacifica]|uniref:superoxide dismutase family protein n=1 Tax=Rheinheimera pacifica TaxID=173990 RepID=UPI0028591C8A|nr:superoxide dismutase family protein [Rheinheimera pacifica]MDR6984858.1 Cu-Zn family superoxide dismutase [Rheinheimera pacifica]
MKLRILPLPLLAAGLLLGCNPDPNPPSAPSGTAAPVSGNAVDGDRYTANTITVRMNQVTAEGVGDSAGTITIRETADGLVFKPQLKGLKAGEHGFHVHQNPSCEPGMKEGERQAAASAGSHLDPADTNQHAGPDGQGHLGDLPMIRVDNNDNQEEVTARRMKLDDIRNRSLIVHQQADDYTTSPAGSSGSPIACGVIK